MTKQDYEIIAKAVAKVKPAAQDAGNATLVRKWDVIDSLCDALARDNARFNPELFVNACLNGREK